MSPHEYEGPFLVRHGKRNQPRGHGEELYLTTVKPVRRGDGLEFVGYRVTLDLPHPHAAADGYRLAESTPRWRNLPGRGATVEQPPAHMTVPTLPTTAGGLALVAA